MSQSSPDLLLLEVPCDRHAPELVRKALAEVHGFDATTDDRVLVASELVTNAVLHSGGEAEHMLQVRASVRQNRLRISVLDPDPSPDVSPRRKREYESGRPWGVRIIERLSERWGCEHPGGYRVWAELALRA